MTRPQDNKPKTVEVITLTITLVTIYAVLLAHATAASYKAGYLSYFGISIDSVPFWPKITDFMIAPVIAIIYIIIATASLFGALLLGNYLGSKTVRLIERSKEDRHKLGPAYDNFTRYFTIILVTIFFIVVSCSLPYFTMQSFGEAVAEKTTMFPKLIDRKVPTMLIHQHEGVGVVKEYDYDTKKFSSSYEVINLVDHKFKIVEIKLSHP